MFPTNCISLSLVALLTGAVSCTRVPVQDVNPFTDLDPLEFDGRQQRVTSEIMPLGNHHAGEVLVIEVLSLRDGSVHILRPDDVRDDAGVIIDGGPLGEPFCHQVTEDGALFLFINAALEPEMEVILEFGSEDFPRPAGQAIIVDFEDDFLACGLYLPTDPAGTEAFLHSIEPVVREGIILELRRIFEDTPAIQFLDSDDPQPECYSMLHYRCNLDGDVNEGLDSVEVEAADSQRGECPTRVLFGAVRGMEEDTLAMGIDPGNRNPNDAADVYTRSFRPSSDCAESLVINSTNNIINALATTGAHEIGHLLGLLHSALIDVMSASPHLGFQRQLDFQRSQVVVRNPPVLGLSTSEDFIRTQVIQDPIGVYFKAIFVSDARETDSRECD